MLVFFFRAIKFALQGFFRNIWLSIVTIIILVMTLFSVTMAAGLNVIADKAIESVQQKVDVSVYFKPEAAETDILNLRYRLENMSGVDSVTYVSQQEALDQFKARHQDEPVILESIEQLGSNPLGATLVLKAADINDYPEILAVLDNQEYETLIQDKNFDDNQAVISRLSDVSDRIQRIGIIMSVIFVIIAVMIMFNTIRINIYTHREEIGIMKLVGASNWFVRAPFLVETLLYAFLAVIVTIFIMYPLLGVITPQLNNFFSGYNLDLAGYFNSHFWKIAGWQFIFVLILSAFSSSIALGKYLRV